jgi:hypothetical protein
MSKAELKYFYLFVHSLNVVGIQLNDWINRENEAHSWHCQCITEKHDYDVLELVYVGCEISHYYTASTLFEILSLAAISCLILQFDEGRNNFEGSVTADAVSKFVQSNRLPIVVEFTQEVFWNIYSISIVHWIIS